MEPIQGDLVTTRRRAGKWEQPVAHEKDEKIMKKKRSQMMEIFMDLDKNNDNYNHKHYDNNDMYDK